MTIAATVPTISYALAGANLGPFSTVWPYEQASDVQAALDPGTGVLQALNQGVDYTLVGATPLVNAGQVTLSNTLLPAGGAWAANAKLVLTRATQTNSETDFAQALTLSPAAIAYAIDHVMRAVQDLNAKVASGGAVAGGATIGVTNGQPVDLPQVAAGTVLLRADNSTVGAAFVLWALFPGAGAWVPLVSEAV